MESAAQLKPSEEARRDKLLEIPALLKTGALDCPSAMEADTTSGDDFQARLAAEHKESAGRLAMEQSRLAAERAGLNQALHEIDERYRNECRALIAQIFTAIAPAFARQSTLTAINEIIEMQLVRKKKPIVVRAHPDLAADLSPTNAAKFSDKLQVSIEADERLEKNQVEIHWKNGGMAHDPDALIADILRVITDGGGTQKD